MTLSVLTPTYNYGRYLERALRSVEQQDLADYEHVVVDGGSTDQTPSILARSTARWVSEPDRGQSDALNKALALASGEWIAWLNADEFYLPDALPTLMANAAGADVVFGDFLLADASPTYQRLVAHHEATRFSLWNYGTLVPTCSVLIRRSVLPPSPWDTSLRTVMDRDLWLRLWNEGAVFRYVPQPVGVFMAHGTNVTAQPARPDHPELMTLRRRYGVSAGSWSSSPARGLGRLDHLVRKTLNGSKRREWAYDRALRGADLDWTSSAQSRRGLEHRLTQARGPG